MSTAVQRAFYPAAIEQKLRIVRRRQCFLAIVRALLLAAAVLLAAMLAAMLADWTFTLFSTTARALLTASALAATVATLLWTGVRPVARSLGLRQAASEVDRVIPHLEERWTTVAHFAESNGRPRAAITAAMLQQVTSEAVALARLVEPARVAEPAKARRAAVWLACAAAAVIAFLAMNWQHHRVLLARFWLPLSNITATQVESLTGDLAVPRGEPLRLAVRTSGLHRRAATLQLAVEGLKIETFELTPSDDSPAQFVYDIPSLQSSLRYRVQAGDGRTNWHTITALDRPSLAEVQVTLTPPLYVNRPVYEKDYLPDRLQAVQGSRLRLRFRPKAALQRFELAITQHGDQTDGQATGRGIVPPETLQLSAGNDGWYGYETVLETDVTIRPELLSPHGLKAEDAQQCRIRVLPDRPPVVRVISPKEETAVKPDEVIDVKFEAHDDHGIAKAELVIYEEPRQPGEPPSILSVEEIPLGDQTNSPHVTATAKLDLSKHALQTGASISFAIRVTDNRLAMHAKAAGESPDVKGRPAENAVAKAEPPSQPIGNYSRTGTTSPIAEPKLAATEHKAVIADQQPPTAVEPNLNIEQTPVGPVPPAGADLQSRKPTNDLAESKPIDANAPAEPAALNSKVAGAVADPQQPDPLKAPQPVDAAAGKSTSAAKPSADNAPSAAQPSSVPADPLVPNTKQPSRDMPNMVSGEATSTIRRASVTDDLRGQFTESSRLRLKIEEKLSSAVETGLERENIQIKIRARLEQIDRELEPAEQALTSLLETVLQSGIADPQIKTLTGVDARLAEVDRLIAALRNESKETPLAFAGLQMVEIATAHVAPARDRVFALIRQPDADARGNSAAALHHVSRARELLAELLVRYDRLLRERKLADAIDQTAKIYEVYVENLHRFLRAQSKPNANPLERKMAVVEVDQDYLDRLRQVTEMRRDLMAEFARMLADDPRLLSKYTDLIKRRQTSLRDRLTNLHERQEAIATELSGWLRVDAAQRDDVWLLAAEVRLQGIAPLAQEASQFAERASSQLPLGIDPGQKTAAAVLAGAKQVAVRARSAVVKARRLLQDPLQENIDLAADIDEMSLLLVELDASLERLAFERPDPEIVDYTNKRLAESRALMERIAGWAETASHLQARQFPGLAKVDQHQLALRTELLRIDIAGIDQQLAAEFRAGVPESVTALANELKQLMESITFNQQAATFELTTQRLTDAETQQALALDGFKQAEELFDRIRRQVIEEADKTNPDNPNIADLVDPTLDRLLERLEREPDLNALLGIPDRPRNLRVMSDFFTSPDGDVPVPSALEQAADQARQRAQQEQKDARRLRPEREPEADKSEQEWREIASAEEAQEKLDAKIQELKHQAEDSATEPDQAARLRQLAEQLQQMRQQLGGRQVNDQQWREMVRSDQMKAILKAAAKGEPLPDTQWNRLMSSLDDGLWQVRRRNPPEEYRQAIEQYQERIRKLLNVETTNETR